MGPNNNVGTKSSRTKARAAFASAVVLLFLSGLAGYVTIYSLLQSQKWVMHTHAVRETLGDVDASLLRAGRARTGYSVLRSDDFLGDFQLAVSEVQQNLDHLRLLTKDNPQQRVLADRLQQAMNRRVELLQSSIRLQRDNSLSPDAQKDLARQTLPISTEITSLTQQMRDTEQQLLAGREKTTRRLFWLMVTTLIVAFVVALQLFALHYRFLANELRGREEAEQNARTSQESLRRLTGRLLQLQDAERRKFSRELHDSLGQYLVGAKMNLEMFATQGNKNLLAEAVRLLDASIAETRTISHLLHPPLLDEAGFSSAAKWYLEGFAQRSGIEVKVDLPDNVNQLPKPIALGFFRVLQESLTNIHRHSGSAKAEVLLEVAPDRAVLRVRDFGQGIPAKLLENLSKRGVNSGVGLAGMRERAHEFGGEFHVQPCAPGTLISVSAPLPLSSHADDVSAAD